MHCLHIFSSHSLEAFVFKLTESENSFWPSPQFILPLGSYWQLNFLKNSWFLYNTSYLTENLISYPSKSIQNSVLPPTWSLFSSKHHHSRMSAVAHPPSPVPPCTPPPPRVQLSSQRGAVQNCIGSCRCASDSYGVSLFTCLPSLLTYHLTFIFNVFYIYLENEYVCLCVFIFTQSCM